MTEASAPRRAQRPVKHGTIGGYSAHRYRGEAPCALCRQAMTDYCRERDRARRPALAAKVCPTCGAVFTARRSHCSAACRSKVLPTERNCSVCGVLFTSVRKSICSRTCAQRQYFAGRRRRRSQERACKVCAGLFVSDRDAAVVCSRHCAGLLGGAGRSEALRQARLPVLHPDPSPMSWLPDRHPARRLPVKPAATWWKVLVSGTCAHAGCGVSFVALAASFQTAPRYCSDRCAKRAARSRGSKRGTHKTRFVVPKRTRLMIYERDGWTCQLCGDPVDPSLDPTDSWAATLDHIVCQSWGTQADHSSDNLRLAHRWCNSVRGDETHHTVDVLRVA